MKLSGKRLWCYYLVDNSLDFLRRDKALYMFMFFFFFFFISFAGHSFLPIQYFTRGIPPKRMKEKKAFMVHRIFQSHDRKSYVYPSPQSFVDLK